MSLALADRPPSTLAEFLEWERHQELRFEWDGVQPIAMNGGTFRHTEIAARLYDALRPGLRGRCTVVRGDLQVFTTDRSRIRYPDLAVTCTPIDPLARQVPEPVLLVEVLSETTSAIDRGIKRAEYTALSSLQGFVIFAQDAPLVLVHERADGFSTRRIEGLDAVLELPGTGLSVRVGDIYDGLI